MVTLERQSGLKLQNDIKTLRKNKGMTQSELADVIEVSRKTINTIENGVFVPSTVLALKLANALEVKVEELFWNYSLSSSGLK